MASNYQQRAKGEVPENILAAYKKVDRIFTILMGFMAVIMFVLAFKCKEMSTGDVWAFGIALIISSLAVVYAMTRLSKLLNIISQYEDDSED